MMSNRQPYRSPEKLYFLFAALMATVGLLILGFILLFF